MKIIFFMLVSNIFMSCEKKYDSIPKNEPIKVMMGVDHLWNLRNSDQDIVIPQNIPEGSRLSSNGWFSWFPEKNMEHDVSEVDVSYWLKSRVGDMTLEHIVLQLIPFDESLKKEEESICIEDFYFKKHPYQKMIFSNQNDFRDVVDKRSLILIANKKKKNSIYDVNLMCHDTIEKKDEKREVVKKIHNLFLLENFSTWDFNPEGKDYHYAIEKGGLGIHLSEDGYLQIKSQKYSLSKNHEIKNIYFWVTDGVSTWREEAQIHFDEKCKKIEYEYSQDDSYHEKFRDRGVDYFVSEFYQDSCTQKILNIKTAGFFPEITWEVHGELESRMKSITIKSKPYKGVFDISLNPLLDFEEDILSLDKTSAVEWRVSFLPSEKSGKRNISFVVDNGRSQKTFYISLNVEGLKTKKMISSTFHNHGKLKLHIIDDLKKHENLSVEEQLEKYLPLYDIKRENLILNKKRKSPLGFHYIYDFYRDSKKDLDQNFVVSTYRNESQKEVIHSIYNGVFSPYKNISHSGQDESFFSARKEVKRSIVHLKEPPLSVEYLKDVKTKEIISRKVLSSSRYRIFLPRNLAVENFKKKDSYQKIIQQNETLEFTTGRALVFETSPAFLLKNRFIKDSSSQELFHQAYQWRALKNIQFDQGLFKLIGPRVQIQDRQAPFSGRGDQSNDLWNKGRGSVSWLAAHTYYHLDTMLEYLENIGFSEDKRLISYPLLADPDAMNGADNSSYDPILKSLFFGRGGIDDAEDPDVIIHELTHALLDEMIPNFKGGDSGAIGEGAGDDLAVSYRRRQSDLHDMNSKVFAWDGVQSWGGRRTNVLYSFYHHGVNYGAHMDMGGFLSDELWSTPLVTARNILLKKGYSHEILDKIILQGYLGIGYSPKMRDVATHIVHVAKMMGYEQVAEIFLDRFYWHGILSDTTKNMFLKVASTEEPWKSKQNLKIPVQLSNYSPKDLESSIFLVSGEGIQISPIFVGELKSDENKEIIVELQLPELECREEFEIQMSWVTNESILATKTIRKNIGTEKRLLGEWKQYREINHEHSVELELYLDVAGDVSQHFQVGLEIDHPWFGDVQVDLIHPSGREVRLIGDSRDDESYFSGWIPSERYPVENMNKIIGLPLKGLWKLRIKDIHPDEHGAITNWKLKDAVNEQCELLEEATWNKI